MLTCGEASGCGSGWAAALCLRLGFTVASGVGVVVACIALHCISRWLRCNEMVQGWVRGHEILSPVDVAALDAFWRA